METVIYGDVLVAVNFIINLMVLNLTKRLTGISVKPFRRYMGAFVGALASFVIFIPIKGLWIDLLVRAGVTALVIGITYWGQSVKNMLRLTIVFFGVATLIAGFVMLICFLLPQELLSYANGILYFDVTPIVLVGCVTAAYLFVCMFDHVFDSGGSREGVWRAIITREGRTVELHLFMDTGNHLTEPFSGLPVMVASMREVTPLLSSCERNFMMGRPYDMPAGLRPVFYNGVGDDGLIYAVRPDSVVLTKDGKSITCEGYLAVSLKEISCQGCTGIFNPRLLGISVNSR
ncbi:MAG: sigma-E processing peptidase SpoIIGA [Angelakisella sp.]